MSQPKISTIFASNPIESIHDPATRQGILDWAIRHDPLYARVMQHAWDLKLSKVEQMEWMVVALLCSRQDLKDRLERLCASRPR